MSIQFGADKIDGQRNKDKKKKTTKKKEKGNTLGRVLMLESA